MFTDFKKKANKNKLAINALVADHDNDSDEEAVHDPDH
jgi:hypothetical protein